MIAAIVPWNKRVTSVVLMLRQPGMPADEKAVHEVELEPRPVLRMQLQHCFLA